MDKKNEQSVVVVPDVGEHDINITLPSGEVIVLQYRNEGDFPSLDVCFSRKRVVYNMANDLLPAPAVNGNEDIRDCIQLVIMLDPNSKPHYPH